MRDAHHVYTSHWPYWGLFDHPESRLDCKVFSVSHKSWKNGMKSLMCCVGFLIYYIIHTCILLNKILCMFLPDELENRSMDFDHSFFICSIWILINTWSTLIFDHCALSWILLYRYLNNVIQDYLTISDAFQLISKFPQIDQFHIHWYYL